MRPVCAYIGLGANVGDAGATLTAAVHALGALPGANLAGVSRLYVTAPIEVTDQPDFHNAVVALDVPAGPGHNTGPIALLLALKSIERAFGRQERFRYGPRELDLDLLLFGEEHMRVERPEDGRSPDPAKATRLLEVPHPKLGRRLFVLAPLADLAPDLVPPGWTESVEAARARRESIEGASAVRAVANWDADLGRWIEAPVLP
ncbi:MAG TPA: 2-amino-4-hydroxy-6-hydroxymethyldihydropteridine diphosphokinase [Candidatus Limnocylindrales bacterium]|jgi:2-amino-4-hydroxy-6-hydroxymethyldihydropteridine diphosphokinase